MKIGSASLQGEVWSLNQQSALMTDTKPHRESCDLPQARARA
jgi:hypothetical protein